MVMDLNRKTYSTLHSIYAVLVHAALYSQGMLPPTHLDSAIRTPIHKVP